MQKIWQHAEDLSAASVLLAMKPRREPEPDRYNRTVHRALGAAVALVCLLSFAPRAPAAEPTGRLPDTGALLGRPGTVLAQTTPAPSDAQPGTQPGTLSPAQPKPKQGASAPSDTAPQAGKVAPPAVGMFSGSARPAGPDLTVEQERALISRGWE
jgi:hypothetical protein